MISVIIPSYNREHLVPDALDSVREQTVRPLEIVVVDDGSTDNTQAVVRRWASEYGNAQLSLTLLVQQNLGGNAARNAGIRAASGDLIAFLDSDDTWGADKLRKQAQLLQSQPVLGAVYCGLEEVDSSSGALLEQPVRSYPQGELFPEILINDSTAPTSCYMVRKTVFDVAGYFDETLEARQDWDMWIRIARHFPIGAVPENLVQLRSHDGARTVSDPEREVRAYTQIREKYRELIDAQPASIRRMAASAYHRRLGRVYFHRNLSRTRALGHYARACFHAPLVFDNYAALAGFFLPRSIRQPLHRLWNRVFGRTTLAIRSH